MLFENLSPDVLRQYFPKNLILKLDAIKLAAFSQKYSPGQVLQGKVVEAVPKGKAIVNFGGEKFLVQLGKPVTPGLILTAKIEQILPTPILKLVDPLPVNQKRPQHSPISPNPLPNNSSIKQGESSSIPVRNDQDIVAPFSRNNLAKTKSSKLISLSELTGLQMVKGKEVSGKVIRVVDEKTILVRINQNKIRVHTPHAENFKPGDPIVARILKEGEGYYLQADSSRPVKRPIVPAMIRPYLADFKTLTHTVASIDKGVLGHPVLSEVEIDSTLIERLKDTVKILQPRDPAQLDGAKIKEMMDRSGIHYEAKMKNLNFENLTAERRIELGRDFKGQMIELAKAVESELAKARLPDILIKQGSELLTQVRQAIQSIEFQQLSTQYSKQENHPILLQIPHSFFGEGETVKIYIRNDTDNQKKNNKSETKVFKLVFLLDLSALGNLKIDASVTQSGISINILGQNPDIIHFINQRTPELAVRMEELGFQVTISGRIQDQVDMEVPDILSNLLVDPSFNLVDIKT